MNFCGNFFCSFWFFRRFWNRLKQTEAIFGLVKNLHRKSLKQIWRKKFCFFSDIFFFIFLMQKREKSFFLSWLRRGTNQRPNFLWKIGWFKVFSTVTVDGQESKQWRHFLGRLVYCVKYIWALNYSFLTLMSSELTQRTDGSVFKFAAVSICR